MVILAPICLGCTHFRGYINGSTGHCDAYPDHIPEQIWESAIDHRQPVESDHGIVFQPKTQDDSAYASLLFDREDIPT